MTPSDILILSGSTRHWLPATISRPNHEAYATNHGYRYHHETFSEGGSWPKPRAIAKAMDDPANKWVFWIDADAVVTNPDIDLLTSCGIALLGYPSIRFTGPTLADGNEISYPDHRTGIIMSTDINGPNAGVMMLQNTPLVRELLWCVNSTGRWMFPPGPNWQDQSAFRFFALQPPYQQLFHFAEQRVMNSYLNELYSDGRPISERSQWQPGDFILHLPGVDDKLRVREMRRALEAPAVEEVNETPLDHKVFQQKEKERLQVKDFIELLAHVPTDKPSPWVPRVNPKDICLPVEIERGPIILSNWEALGDLLLLSTLPERYAKEQGVDVYWSSKSKPPRSKEGEKLLCYENTDLCGYIDAEPTHGSIRFDLIGHLALSEPANPIAIVEKAHGFLPPYSKYPKVYYEPKPDPRYTGAVLFDLGAHTQGFRDKDVKDWLNLIVLPRHKGRKLYVVSHPKGVTGQIDYRHLVPQAHNVKTTSLKGYIDLIASVHAFVSLESGAQALASAVKQDNPTPEINVLMSCRTHNSRIFTFPNCSYHVVPTNNPHWWPKGRWP